jgi:hypothetical protein
VVRDAQSLRDARPRGNHQLADDLRDADVTGLGSLDAAEDSSVVGGRRRDARPRIGAR